MPAPYQYTEEQITAALMAVIVNAGNKAAAVRQLEETEGFRVTPPTLSQWVSETHAVRYLELRDKYRDQIERQLAERQTDAAMIGTEVAVLGLQRAQERLESGKDQDPSRTAANAATAADKMVRTSLTLQNRPTSIKETRGLEETLRSLAAMGVIHLPEATVEAPVGELEHGSD